MPGMSDLNLELLERLVERLLEGQREIAHEIAAIKDAMATREHVTRLWRLTEDRGSMLRTELVDADATMAGRLAEVEARLDKLEPGRD